MRPSPLWFIAVALLASGCPQPPGTLLPDGGTSGNGGCWTDAELCAAQAKTCGALTTVDGCGKSRTVQCGSCNAPQECGGAGVANVCGASCRSGCPAGFSCNLFGVCAGGSASSLTLDAKAVLVQGVVKLNGSVPTTGASCTGSSATTTKTYLTFSDEASGTLVNADVLCASPTFAFSTLLPPSTYRETVYGFGPDWANLPKGMLGVDPGLVISGAKSDLVADAKAVLVQGVVKLNGQLPTTGASCTGSSATTTKTYVTFTDAASGTAVNADVLCGSPTFAFTTMLPPSTYRVTVYGFGPDWANLPKGMLGVDPALVISGGKSDLVVDAKAVAVQGVVKLNGSVPTTGASCTGSSATSTKTYVTFTDEGAGTSVNADVLCGSPTFAFATMLPPSTYRVTVYGFGPDWANLPKGMLGVVTRLDIR